LLGQTILLVFIMDNGSPMNLSNNIRRGYLMALISFYIVIYGMHYAVYKVFMTLRACEPKDIELVYVMWRIWVNFLVECLINKLLSYENLYKYG
jgi:hypothetical protein